MTSPVELYVYDLSNGMARQLSAQLTGRQIDGIWHTSVVVFGKEVFYGQGITTTLPGRSHHGAPHQVLNMGETALDQDTFNDYLQEIKEHYTADKYHLLDFNCNSFTNDCIGFLTGGTIPSFIKDLPTDFLSTPFGAALRPTIDAMYRGPGAGTAPQTTAANASRNTGLSSSMLQAVANQAANGSAHTNNIQGTNSLTSPMHVITNPATFNNFLKTHKAAVAFFTSATCPPCRMIEPIFERLSEEKGMHEDRDGAGFAKIDIGVGMGRNLATEWGIRATPTFIFYLDGKKLDELKGADANELRTQVDLLLFQAYPPHPHTSLSIPTIQALSLNPIIFSQVPAIETVVSKLSSFIDEASPSSISQSKDQTKVVLSGNVLPYLKARFPSPPPSDPKALPSATPTLLASWTQATSALALALPVESLFPLVDMWRLAFLDPAVGSWLATLNSTNPPTDPISMFLPKTINALDNPNKGSRNYILTVVRMLCNAFSHSILSQKLLANNVTREKITGQVLVPSLLHQDGLVRTAAASLAFDVSTVFQKLRVESVRNGKRIRPYDVDVAKDEMADWEIEMVSAVIEAIDREKENEEVVHRLTAALAFFIRLSPQYETQIKPLMEVLNTRKLLKDKLVKGPGWNIDGGIGKKEIRKLVEEVAMKLCP